jgi:hypothetical protein
MVNEQIIDFILDFGLYSLWLFTFALTLASSLILLNYYLKSRKTPLGRTAFYFFLNSFWWSIASALITLPIITTIGLAESYIYLIFPFMAGIASILGTYERSRIQSFLQPGTKKQIPHPNLWFILSFGIFVVALIAIIGGILDIPVLNIGTGSSTGLGFMLISGLLVASAYARAQKFVYAGSSILLIYGVTAIMGYALDIPILYSPLPGEPTTVTTGLIFIIVGFWIAISNLSGLKLWITKMVMAFAVLSSIILAIVTSLSYHTQDLTTLSTLLIVLVSGTLIWQSWRSKEIVKS